MPNINRYMFYYKNMYIFYKDLKFLNNIGFSHVLQHDVHFDIYQSSFWPSHWRDAPQCDVACRKIEKLFFFQNTNHIF